MFPGIRGPYADRVPQLLPLADEPAHERADAARNRERVLAAAARLLDERGADCLTMDAVAAAAGVARLMGSLLYEVEPVDPLTYATIAVALLGLAALASYLPARRASSVDPAESLAAE